MIIIFIWNDVIDFFVVLGNFYIVIISGIDCFFVNGNYKSNYNN